MNINMTEGNSAKILIRFCVPMLISTAFQQLYNIADSIIVGKFVGTKALAAVGASYPITMIFMAVAFGLNIGCSVIIARFFGRDDKASMKEVINTAFVSTAVIAVLFTILGKIFCKSMLTSLGTPGDIFSGSVTYLNIYIYGLLFLFLYNIATGVFTALGDSKTPLYFLIVSSVGNVLLDLLFVCKFNMGIAGAAWATFITQGIAAVCAVLALFKRLKSIETEERVPIFTWSSLKRIMTVGIPSILQQSFVSVGNLFIQFNVNNFGSDVIAGYSAAVKLNTFAITLLAALSASLSNFTSQNVGARKYQRVKEGFRYGTMIGMAFITIFIVGYFFFGSFFSGLFMKSGSDKALQTSVLFLKIVSPFYYLVGIKLISDGVIRGGGAMTGFMVSTSLDLVLRVVLAYVLANALNDSIGIWISWPIGWTVSGILSFSFYKKGIWKNTAI